MSLWQKHYFLCFLFDCFWMETCYCIKIHQMCMWFSTHKARYFKIGIVGWDIHPRRIGTWTTKKNQTRITWEVMDASVQICYCPNVYGSQFSPLGTWLGCNTTGLFACTSSTTGLYSGCTPAWRAAAYSWYTCPCSCSCHLSWCSGRCSCSTKLLDVLRGKCKGGLLISCLLGFV